MKNLEATEAQINNAISSFNPFGYLDIKAAVNAAINAGKGTDFVYECVEEFSDNCGVKIEDCDPVYCVMDAVLQEARNEISDLTDFDFCNDCTNGEIYTAGNFMCTSYDYRQEAKDELINALIENSVIIEDLSEATQYFLAELEISQEDVNALSQEIQ
jgi:hypothetical protein